MDVMRIDPDDRIRRIFSRDPTLLASMRHARTRRLHLLGLTSQGGVHSQLTHLYALLKMAKQEGVEDVCVHCFMDGRDTPSNSGIEYLQELQKQMQTIGVGRIGSISGRYYAMDRDKPGGNASNGLSTPWSKGAGHKATDAVEALKRSYEADVTDEFVEPVTIVDRNNEPVGRIRDDDAVIFYNYRADRGREMTMALTDPALERPSRSLAPRNLHYTTMTQYDKTFPLPFVLPREHPNNILADVFARLNWKNLRVAETEKYAHVTYFFNGGNEKPYPGEEREMAPSPKVATYDLKPEMNAQGVTDFVVKAVNTGDFDVIVMNFANADMVGHSGKMEPTVRAVEAVDACLGSIYQALRQKGGAWIISADHGNAETMIDPVTKHAHTYHTTNPVPFVLVNDQGWKLRAGGALQDIAPTLLGVLGEQQPVEMKGSDLRLPSSV